MVDRRDHRRQGVLTIERARVNTPAAEMRDDLRVPLLGIPDESILHTSTRRGMITRREVRLIALAELELHGDDVLWDIGAGSGSVSLEAARLSPASACVRRRTARRNV